ncbi:MAG: hypothetical protein C5B59_11760 [Bacteroidetes bacterium]|nr:MAG: hypothetical protein C5B59_11760 [Bacteroidota bacterium]
MIRRHISQYIELNDEQFDYFLSLTTSRKLRKKQYLLQAGEVCRYESFVTKGCLRAYSIDEKGKEHIVQFATEDWWIADLNSFLTQTPAFYNIDALEDSELIQIEKNALEQIYSCLPQFERFFRIKIQKAFTSLQSRLNESLSGTATDRYLSFISKYPSFEQRLPQHQVASYLGISAEFLSKIRQNLSK